MGFVEFAGGEVTGINCLGDEVGGFSVTYAAQGEQVTALEVWLEVMVEGVLREAVGDQDNGITGLQKDGAGEQVAELASVRLDGGEEVAGDDLYSQVQEALFDAFLLEGVLGKGGGQRRQGGQGDPATVADE